MSWKGFGKRIEQAILDRQSQIGQRLTLGGIGDAVAKRERRTKPYGVSTVAGWLDERNEPTLATFTALAAELNTTPEWLAFGAHTLVYTKEHPNAEPVLVTPPKQAQVSGSRRGPRRP